ncbi:hypothetical protein Y032_0101g3353 [Ancylostoma ceylanicum]|nr:hypothetical protein Y032_0101g3353 [Ancylostoma ceylanicum]
MDHEQLRHCEVYARRRQLIEDTILYPERTLFLTDEESEEYSIAERKMSEAITETFACSASGARPSFA